MNEEVRNGAMQLAGYTNAVNTQVEEFKKSRDALAKARQLSINDMEKSALGIEMEIADRTAPWSFKENNKELEFYKQIVLRTEEAEQSIKASEDLQKSHQNKIKAAKSKIKFNKKLPEVTKALAELGEEMNLIEMGEFYFDYFSEVNDSLKDLKEKARNDAITTEDELKDKTTANTKIAVLDDKEKIKKK